jgi:hypothetical protein
VKNLTKEEKGKQPGDTPGGERQATRIHSRRRRASNQEPFQEEKGRHQEQALARSSRSRSASLQIIHSPNHRWILLHIVPACITNICLHAWLVWEHSSLRYAKKCFAKSSLGSFIKKGI